MPDVGAATAWESGVNLKAFSINHSLPKDPFNVNDRQLEKAVVMPPSGLAIIIGAGPNTVREAPR